MRIGTVGAGHIGGTLAKLFVAERTVAELIDQIGFDPVDAGTLAEGGRKHQTSAPAYTQGLSTAELRARLTA